jgi:hypothetical protein
LSGEESIFTQAAEREWLLTVSGLFPKMEIRSVMMQSKKPKHNGLFLEKYWLIRRRGDENG